MRIVVSFFDVKQKAAYAMRMSDSSSDVCSSDLVKPLPVCDLVGLAFGLRVADCGVGQRHLGASLLWGPSEAPKFAPICHIYRQTEAIADDQRMPINYRKSKVFSTISTRLLTGYWRPEPESNRRKIGREHVR